MHGQPPTSSAQMSPQLLEKALEILRDRYSLQNFDEMKARVSGAGAGGAPGAPEGSPAEESLESPGMEAKEDGSMPVPGAPPVGATAPLPSADPGAPVATAHGLPPGIEAPPKMTPDEFRHKLGRGPTPAGHMNKVHLGTLKGGADPSASKPSGFGHKKAKA